MRPLLDLNTLKIRIEEHHSHINITVGGRAEAQVPHESNIMDDIQLYPRAAMMAAKRMRIEVVLPPDGSPFTGPAVEQDKLF